LVAFKCVMHEAVFPIGFLVYPLGGESRYSREYMHSLITILVLEFSPCKIHSRAKTKPFSDADVSCHLLVGRHLDSPPCLSLQPPTRDTSLSIQKGLKMISRCETNGKAHRAEGKPNNYIERYGSIMHVFFPERKKTWVCHVLNRERSMHRPGLV